MTVAVVPAPDPGTVPPAGSAEAPAGRLADLIGRERVRRWTPAQAMVWTGLAGAVEAIRRDVAEGLERAHGLSPSALGLLGRLSAAPGGRARLSALAADGGLSLSRVSRLVDGLARRGLVERRPCPEDARAVNAHITRAGRALARRGQEWLAGRVEERFLARLTPGETEALAAALARLGDGAGAPCDAVDA